MLQTKREDGLTPAGGAYAITTWDDETGNAEILENGSADHLIRRREWELLTTGAPGPDGISGELRAFDSSGEQTETRPIRHQLARD